MIYLMLAGVLVLSSCTLFKRENENTDEIVDLAETVLKKNQGISIDITPIEKEKK